MLPPAPVTMTTAPRIDALSSASSSWTGARPSRSPIANSRSPLDPRDLGDLVDPAEHRQAADQHADLEVIVVEEADRMQRQIAARGDLARDHHAGLARADQQHALALAPRRALPALDQLAVEPP